MVGVTGSNPVPPTTSWQVEKQGLEQKAPPARGFFVACGAKKPGSEEKTGVRVRFPRAGGCGVGQTGKKLHSDPGFVVLPACPLSTMGEGPGSGMVRVRSTA